MSFSTLKSLLSAFAIPVLKILSILELCEEAENSRVSLTLGSSVQALYGIWFFFLVWWLLLVLFGWLIVRAGLFVLTTINFVSLSSKYLCYKIYFLGLIMCHVVVQPQPATKH